MRSMLWRKTKQIGKWKAAVSGAWAWGMGWAWVGFSKGKVNLGANRGEDRKALGEIYLTCWRSAQRSVWQESSEPGGD